jgi:class 3 adenylate cyclase/CHASE2 domain-containing sensor protein
MNAGWFAQLSRAMRGSEFASTLVLLIVAFSTAFLATEAVAHLSALAYMESFVDDIVIRTWAPPQKQSSQIVIVVEDETTLDPFRGVANAQGQSVYHYRDPIDRQALGDLLIAIAGKHPAAIGVDVRLDRPTENEKDKSLRHTLRTLSASVPIVTAYSEKGLSDDQLESLYSYSVLQSRAFVDVREDPNTHTVRAVYAGAHATHDGRYYPSFARALADNVGVSTAGVGMDLLWRAPPANSPYSFAQYPAQYVSLLPESWFDNKIVLVGEDLSLIDQKNTPFGTAPDVVVQANALAQLLRAQSLHRVPSPFLPWAASYAFVLALALAGALLGETHLPLALRAGTGLAGVAGFWIFGGIVFFYEGVLLGFIAPTLAAIGSFTVMDSLTGREARRQRQFIHGAFASYVSPKLVERLMRDPDRMSFDGERRNMTFLFSDVANFSTMAEGIDSKELPIMLNAYLEGMTEIVMKHDGMVDKFIGDSVFAIFNAPIDLPNHEELAVRCALAMDEFCERFRAEQVAKGIPFGLTRIGVHTGVAVIGNFGSQARFTYTASGDAVNTASRLEALNKHFGTRFCVSAATAEQCKSTEFRPIAAVVVKGKTIAVDVCEPIRKGEYSDDYLERYTVAYAKLASGSPDAAALFRALGEERPDDPCVALHLKRLAAGEISNKIVMDEK